MTIKIGARDRAMIARVIIFRAVDPRPFGISNTYVANLRLANNRRFHVRRTIPFSNAEKMSPNNNRVRSEQMSHQMP